jgi:hypothetical protein
MHWHHCLGHLAFKKLQQLARHNEIPKRLVNVRAPRRAGCLFGTITKVLWRGKERKSKHTVFVATKPGECFLLTTSYQRNQASSAKPKEILPRPATRMLQFLSTITQGSFFVYLMTRNLNLLETIQAKQAFERFAAQHGVRIQYYQCGNG